jgi:hypothetical protein
MANINNYPLTATVINDEDYYDVDYWNGSSYETRKISGATLKANFSATGATNTSSTQWSKTVGSPVPLPNGDVANGMTFFDNATDKVATGTTSYDEYDISHGIDALITGTSGSCNINILGTDYLLTFNTSIRISIANWISANFSTLQALGVNVGHNDGSPINANGEDTIRFCSTEAILNAITVTNVSGNLAGTMQNFFTGGSVAAYDHILVPYTGRPYDGKRIHHLFRVNFDIVSGADQTLALSLRRYFDDSIIGSESQVFRNQDVEGVQYVFATYTNDANDPFVLGGFYFCLRNDSGTAIEVSGDVGILVQQTFQSPIVF